MRFFSNEAQENVDDRADSRAAHDPDQTMPVPQQRAGSPWHDTDPAPQPTAVGTSPVADTGTVRSPEDKDADLDSGKKDTASDFAPADKTDVANDPVPADEKDDRSDFAPADGKDTGDPVVATGKKDTEPDAGVDRKDADKIDEALEDRGTFQDPHVAGEDEPRPAEKLTPESEAVTPSGPSPFFPAGDTQPLRDRWRDVQLRFVDDPKGATAEAASLVDEAVDKLSQALRDHRGSFAKGTDDTEALRVELRGYRDILDRLLGL
jgi:hypothetical protein